MEMWMKFIMAVLGAITTGIPLVIALYNTIKTAKATKNWAPVMKTVIALMTEAEQNLTDGASKKEWVMDSVRTTAQSLGCKLDEQAVSNMIDEIAEASKVINKK